jgi:hypothetical protein
LLLDRRLYIRSSHSAPYGGGGTASYGTIILTLLRSRLHTKQKKKTYLFILMQPWVRRRVHGIIKNTGVLVIIILNHSKLHQDIFTFYSSWNHAPPEFFPSVG